MKKAYITPLTEVNIVKGELMIAASPSDQFAVGQDNQSIILTDEDYDGEFGVKEENYDIDW